MKNRDLLLIPESFPPDFASPSTFDKVMTTEYIVKQNQVELNFIMSQVSLNLRVQCIKTFQSYEITAAYLS